MRATLAVLAVVLFFLLFAALVVGLGYLVWWSIIFPMSVINKFTILAKLGAIAGSAMLFIFTLKFAFKLKNHVPTNRLELHRKDQPQLFALVDAVCDATGAPRPRKVHADPDVNAYVAYTNTWLSLFLPVRKDLTIGMGLVAALDRSELKAVLAHEFGHFAQRSMRIGSYIHSANTIIHDLIYQRDKWDDLLDEWRSADLRLSFGAWLITPLVWTIRRTLGLFHLLLSRMHASLSREMEFNADKVAVRAAGSEAIISALWKLDHGQQAWNDTLNHTYLAAQKGLFVEDIYHHHDLALHRGAPIR
ncbi:MAG: M48 family metalloprotease, partial [Flavobacteriales bacterium]|nr:M48 family metalloprotease [Flavobacteriales bacterium]